MKKKIRENYNINELDSLFKQIVNICNINDCQLSMYVNYTSLFGSNNKETYYKLYPNNIERTYKEIKKEDKENLL